MSEAIITGIVAIIVCVINNWALMAKQRAQTEKTVALIEYKITELSERVQKHNQIVERTFKLEESTALQDAELKRLNERLKIVEGGKHE